MHSSNRTITPFLRRRGFLAAAGLSAIGAHVARAAPAKPDVGVYCEPTLAPAIGAAGVLFGATPEGGPVAVLTAPAGLLLEQIKQNPAEDLLFIPASAMDRAAWQGFIDPGTRRDGWKNRLVLATRRDQVPPGIESDPARLLASGRVAVTDPTPASTLDGMGVLQDLGLAAGLAGRLMGAANTADVAFLVRTNAARFGLMFMTDVLANPDLVVAMVLDPARAPPVVYAAALSTKPKSRNAKPFLAFLEAPEGAARLGQAGLEAA